MTRTLQAQPLTKKAFANYGDVIEIRGARHFSINGETFERFHDLAKVDVGTEQDGRALISIVRCNQAASLPYEVRSIERHPLGTQAFYPLSASPMVIVVAPPTERVEPNQVQAFVSNGSQGVNFYRGTWHMPLIALEAGQQFVIVDRGGPGDNCDEVHFRQTDELVVEL